MCGGARSLANVRGLPVEVEVCRDHVHARGNVELAPGTVVAVDVTASRASIEKRLDAIANALSDAARRIAVAPELASLFLGLSIVAPGKKITAPSKKASNVNMRAWSRIAGIVTDPTAVEDAGRLADVLFREMGNEQRAPASRLALEAQYTDLAARLADRGLSIVRIQRAAKGAP